MAALNCNDDSGVIQMCPYFSLHTPEEMSGCHSESASLSNETTTGLLHEYVLCGVCRWFNLCWLMILCVCTSSMRCSGLPGIGVIPIPTFFPCSPSPTWYLDGSCLGQVQNPNMCFALPNTQNLTTPIGSPPEGLRGCTSQTCVFVDCGSATSTLVHLKSGSVTFAADNYGLLGSWAAVMTSDALINLPNDPALQSLFQSVAQFAPITYRFTLRPGFYNLRFGFYANTSSVFDISINGQILVASFSILAAAGARDSACNVTLGGVTVFNNSSSYSNEIEITLTGVDNIPQISWLAISPPAYDSQIFGAATSSYKINTVPSTTSLGHGTL